MLHPILWINLFILKLRHNIDSLFCSYHWIVVGISLATGVVYYLDSCIGKKTDYMDITKLLDRWLIIFMYVKVHLYAYKGNIVWYTYVIVIIFRCFQVALQEAPNLFEKASYKKVTHNIGYQVSFLQNMAHALC